MRTRTRVSLMPMGTNEVEVRPDADYFYLPVGYMLDEWYPLGSDGHSTISPYPLAQDASIFVRDDIPVEDPSPTMVRSFEVIVDAQTFHYEEKPPRPKRPSRYKGKNPRPPKQKPPRKVRVKDVITKKKWAFLPVTHIKKRYGDIGGADFELKRKVNSDRFLADFPYTNTHCGVRVGTPSVRIRGLSPLLVDPISPDGTVMFLSREAINAATPDKAYALSTLRRRALRAMVPDMEAGFSLPRFLAELRDLPGMIRGVKRLLEGLWPFLERLMHNPFKALSREHLSATFGWIPFLKDMKTIVNRLVNLRRDVERFIWNADKRLTYHWGAVLPAADLKSSDFWFDTTRTVQCPTNVGSAWHHLRGIFDTLNFSVHEWNELESCTYHATMEFTYQIRDLWIFSAVLAGLDRFGLNLSISDVWSQIPFSFVVDWVFDVQSWLEKNLDYSNLPVTLQIEDFCDSIKIAYKVNRQVELVDTTGLPVWFTPNGTVMAQPMPVSDWTVSPVSSDLCYRERCYYRWQGAPPLSTEDFPNLRTPSGYALVQSAALLSSRIERSL